MSGRRRREIPPGAPGLLTVPGQLSTIGRRRACGGRGAAMRILTEQMDEMGRTCAEAFVDRLTAFVRAELRGEAGDVTREDVVTLVERGGRYGFTLQSTLATYVIAARALGDGFEERLPEARALLLDDTPEELRAFALERLTVARLSPPLSEPPPSSDSPSPSPSQGPQEASP